MLWKISFMTCPKRNPSGQDRIYGLVSKKAHFSGLVTKPFFISGFLNDPVRGILFYSTFIWSDIGYLPESYCKVRSVI